MAFLVDRILIIILMLCRYHYGGIYGHYTSCIVGVAAMKLLKDTTTTTNCYSLRLLFFSLFFLVPVLFASSMKCRNQQDCIPGTPISLEYYSHYASNPNAKP